MLFLAHAQLDPSVSKRPNGAEVPARNCQPRACRRVPLIGDVIACLSARAGIGRAQRTRTSTSDPQAVTPVHVVVSVPAANAPSSASAPLSAYVTHRTRRSGKPYDRGLLRRFDGRTQSPCRLPVPEQRTSDLQMALLVRQLIGG